MIKVALIARREFLAAVANRGFLIGLLMMPVLGALFAVVTPFLLMPRSQPVTGDIVVIDRSGVVAGELQRALDPAVSAQRRARDRQRVLARAPQAAKDLVGEAALADAVVRSTATIRIAPPPGGVPHTVDTGKAWLLQDSPEARHLAMVVIGADALTPRDESMPAYEVYVSKTLDRQAEAALHEALREAIITVRTKGLGVDRARMEAMLRVEPPQATTVAVDGEREVSNGFNMVLPMVLAALMVLGIMVGGQTLLTSTIEEKSSRVIEVMLSAVSPLQLMAGKILGQLAVSLLVLIVYAGLGIALLISTALIGLLDLWLLVYLLAFFLITYVFFGAVFASAGAAVNDMKEAQTLMGPLMLLLMGPWLLAFPIMRAPDSTLAVVLSFVPPVNSFVMMLRLASTTPPPVWQVLLSMAIGIAAAVAAIWFAAKVFRIGLLMHGKPPNLATLIRWARAA